MGDHVTEEELEQYCLSGLAEVRCGRVEEHLLLCGTCRDRLMEVEDFIVAMRQAGRRWSDGHRQERTARAGAGGTGSAAWSGRTAPIVFVALLIVCAAVWSGHRSSAPAAVPFTIELTAVRGAAPGRAPAGRPLLLELDMTGLSDGPFAGEVVDASGGRVAQFPVDTPARVKALASGGYYVRIYRSSGELLREFALTIQP
jgi:hypothetical protein